MTSHNGTVAPWPKELGDLQRLARSGRCNRQVIDSGGRGMAVWIAAAVAITAALSMGVVRTVSDRARLAAEPTAPPLGELAAAVLYDEDEQPQQVLVGGLEVSPEALSRALRGAHFEDGIEYHAAPVVAVDSLDVVPFSEPEDPEARGDEADGFVLLAVRNRASAGADAAAVESSMPWWLAAGLLALWSVLGGMALCARRWRRAMRHALQTEEASHQATSNFVANMSHEMRTPMNAIIGNADLLAEGATGGQQRQCVEAIRRNGKHLLALISDVLDLSKMESGGTEIESVDCSAVEILADVEAILRPRAEEKGLRFLLESTTPVTSVVRTDPARLLQILLNLVGNAIKFTETGEVRVIVSCPGLETAAPRLRIAVADTGVGMSEEALSSIFEPFRQGDGSMTRAFGGTGLGLTIARRFTRLLGGDLTVSSQPGVGSVFTATIDAGPAGGALVESLAEAVAARRKRDAPQQSPASVECAVPDPGGSADALDANVRMLLAEDGPDNQKLISLIMRKAGFEVDIAENGRVAVQRVLDSFAAGRPYCAILMDIQMPELDGCGATEEIRRQGYRGPIIAVTANTSAENRERALTAGCDEFVTKPVRLKVLMSAIERQLGPAMPVAG